MDPEKTHAQRVIWLAGTRGEILLLGPAYQALTRLRPQHQQNWFLHTGEHGMAAYQVLDFLGLIPDEAAPLCHPADEPAIRLKIMLERAEAFVRQHKGTHIIFCGCGPTAAGAALYCHARGGRGLWLRPPDPAGLIARLRWEAGLERVIGACAPSLDIWQIPAMPDLFSLPSLRWDVPVLAGVSTGIPPEGGTPKQILEKEIPALRPAAPLVLVAVLRREWGYLNDTTSLLARAAAQWASAIPDADWFIISNLNARLEGPVRSLKNSPSNLLLSPPLPYPVYRALLSRARLLITDSALIAAEGLDCSIPTATLGDMAGEQSSSAPLHRPLVPADLTSQSFLNFIKETLTRPPPAGLPSQASATPILQIRQAIENWLR